MDFVTGEEENMKLIQLSQLCDVSSLKVSRGSEHISETNLRERLKSKLAATFCCFQQLFSVFGQFSNFF